LFNNSDKSRKVLLRYIAAFHPDKQKSSDFNTETQKVISEEVTKVLIDRLKNL